MEILAKKRNVVQFKTPLTSLLFSLTLIFSSLFTGCGALTEAEQTDLLNRLLEPDSAAFSATLGQIVDADDRAFIAPLIDLVWADQIGVIEGDRSAEILLALERLSNEEIEGDWVDWVSWYAQSAHDPPAGYVAWKGELFGGLDSEFAEFFDGPVEDEFRVEEVVWGGVKKDGIPSLDFLEQVPILEAEGYTPKDAVFGISINGDHRAYPLRVMDWHEMANDVVGGVPIALTYCTLCGSAIVYKTASSASAEPVVFGSSGLLYRSNKLMFDRQTNTLWSQLSGRPVMGPLVEQVEPLEMVPIVITTVEAWAEQHPDSTILPLETGFFRDYTAGAAYGEYFVRDELLFPLGEIDDRLPAKSQVFALEVGENATAYPLDLFAQKPIINDTVGRTNVVLIAASSNINVYGYSYELEYITYSAGGEIRAYERGEQMFGLSAEGELIDENGEAWQVQEEALVNVNGERLERLSGHVSFWFGWQSFFPETAVYGGEE